MSDCRIILVDDHTLFRGGLRGLLDRYEGFRVVGEAGSGEELLERIGEWQADVVFMDIAMPGMGGAEATQRLLALRPQWRVITLSMFGDEHYYQRMVEAGARGVLLKDSPFDEVVRAVETVHGGGTYFREPRLGSLTGRMCSSERSAGADEPLSARETEILVCVCRGLSNQEIADKLFISKRTVDKHRANILEKTGCRNTASLVVYAIRQGLVDLL